MTHEIQQLMQKLRLPGMRAAYDGIISTKNLHSIGNDELLNLILQAEWDERENSKSKPEITECKVPNACFNGRDRLLYSKRA